MELIELNSEIHVKNVIDIQYNLLLTNETTKVYFEHLNLESHLPNIYSFWCFILQIENTLPTYTGNVFKPHTQLNLTLADFVIWENCLQQALKPYTGEKKVEWLTKVKQQILTFTYKLGLIENNTYFK